MASSRKPGDASAHILAIGAEAKRQENDMDAAAGQARATAVAMHLDERLLLLQSKGRMEFCTQSVELNEVIL